MRSKLIFPRNSDSWHAWPMIRSRSTCGSFHRSMHRKTTYPPRWIRRLNTLYVTGTSSSVTVSQAQAFNGSAQIVQAVHTVVHKCRDGRNRLRLLRSGAYSNFSSSKFEIKKRESESQKKSLGPQESRSRPAERAGTLFADPFLT